MAIAQSEEVMKASPVGAVVSAWNALEVMANETLTHYPQVPLPRRGGSARTSGELVRSLQAAGMKSEAVDILHDLRRLRNTAVHGGVVTENGARDFVASCELVAEELLEMTGPTALPRVTAGDR